MGEKFLQHIEEELIRLKDELNKTKENMKSAQQIYEEAKVKQSKLVQELEVVDKVKQQQQTNLDRTEQKEDKPEEVVFDDTDDETNELEKLENE
ncbi:MAG: hypothetical protein CL489_11920 [Acidobacteria bacterium]|nr:hypothetical protein [Acidobacteriota bacterium]|tara:strand:- start:167 stop:448 length:282 start_codon:yes stop_codon:yes gene_type:complete